MARLLGAVRLGLLDNTYLVEKVKAHQYVCTNEEAMLRVVEALKYVYRLGPKEHIRVGS